MTYDLNKKCERCDTEIPEHYGNLLCDSCYSVVVAEREKKEEERKAQQAAELLKSPESPTHPSKVEDIVPAPETPPASPSEASAPIPTTCDHSNCGISDPAYIENPEADDKDQILANLAQFIYTHRDADHPKGRKSGIMLYYHQRNAYTFIRNYMMKKALEHPQFPKYVWKAKVIDVGCGSGVGSNIMSQEADFVWGIDKNEFSIEFAKECFTREKNGEYYSNQLTFDVIDLVADTRTFMAFDIVTAIEIAEHIWDVNGFLNQLKRFTKRDRAGAPLRDHPTEFFISTPNRNSPKIRKDKPENPFHCREWTSQEFRGLLEKHFEQVELLSMKGTPILDDTVDTPILAKCSMPKI